MASEAKLEAEQIKDSREGYAKFVVWGRRLTIATACIVLLVVILIAP